MKSNRRLRMVTALVVLVVAIPDVLGYGTPQLLKTSMTMHHRLHMTKPSQLRFTSSPQFSSSLNNVFPLSGAIAFLTNTNITSSLELYQRIILSSTLVSNTLDTLLTEYKFIINNSPKNNTRRHNTESNKIIASNKFRKGSSSTNLLYISNNSIINTQSSTTEPSNSFIYSSSSYFHETNDSLDTRTKRHITVLEEQNSEKFNKGRDTSQTISSGDEEGSLLKSQTTFPVPSSSTSLKMKRSSQIEAGDDVPQVDPMCRDKQELDQCLEKVVYNQNIDGLPYTKEELHKLCSAFKGGMVCVDRYTERCLPAHSKLQLEENLTGARAFLAFLCDDKVFQRDYLSHSPCIKQVSKEWHSCHDHFKNLVTQELERDHIGPHGDKIIWRNICCLRKKFLTCVYHVGYLNCGRAGAEFLKKVSATLSYSEPQRQQCLLVKTCSSAVNSTVTHRLCLLLVMVSTLFVRIE